MDPQTPSPPQPGQRALAAIVFTDVVSFSARMQADEETTLRLLQRDFGAMRDLCGQHQGAVLKTTGDGLLMYFNSAVQAVACALAVQRHFAGQPKEADAAAALVHRVGIHLGDVFVSEQDVMGDGVNIAARLQAEAEPGGICISQTVYDVVKNKLALHVTKLGPRELKNISESIPIYKLLLEAQAVEAGSGAPFPAAAQTAAREAAAAAGERAAQAGRQLGVLASNRRLWLVLAAAAVIAVAALVVLQVRTQRQLTREREQADAARAALTATLEDSAKAAASEAEELAGAVGDLRQQMQVYRRQFLEKYDFAGLAAAVRRDLASGAVPAGARALQRSAEQMAVLKTWTIGELQRHTREKPLLVRELSGASPKEFGLFVGNDRLVYFVGGGAVRGRPWTDVKPAILGAAIVAAMLDARPTPGKEIVQGALTYSRLYNLPEMTEALRARRPARGGK